MKRFVNALWALAAILLTACAGKAPATPSYETTWAKVPDNLRVLEEYIQQREDSLPVRKDNQARIIWQDKPYQKTKYAFVYLHGFAGSYRDGYPLNLNVADTFGANIYMARWAGHGLKPPASMDDFSAENAWESAKEALAIGHRLGEKVIIMSTSTGGTLGIKLAAVFQDSVHALINLSPNIDDDQKTAILLETELGPALARLASGGENQKISYEEPEAAQYWDTIYPAQALVDLQILVGSTMEEEVFRKVSCPVLTLYYHENFLEEDEHVEVSEYPEAHALFATPDSLKQLTALETPKTHFIGSDIRSSDYKTPQQKVIKFCREVLGMELETR